MPQTSTIVGFDLHANQPRLSAFPHYRDIAPRIKWVHGNLYVILLCQAFVCDACLVVSLDGLPFPPSSFDFVRIVNIGLGVPEYEVIHLTLLFERSFR